MSSIFRRTVDVSRLLSLSEASGFRDCGWCGCVVGCGNGGSDGSGGACDCVSDVDDALWRAVDALRWAMEERKGD